MYLQYTSAGCLRSWLESLKVHSLTCVVFDAGLSAWILGEAET